MKQRRQTDKLCTEITEEKTLGRYHGTQSNRSLPQPFLKPNCISLNVNTLNLCRMQYSTCWQKLLYCLYYLDVLCVCVTGLKLFYSGGTFTFKFHFKIKMWFVIWFDLGKNDSWFEDVIWDLICDLPITARLSSARVIFAVLMLWLYTVTAFMFGCKLASFYHLHVSFVFTVTTYLKNLGILQLLWN